LGAGGAGGIDANNGNNGGNTTATVAGTTITGNGGAGGEYNNNLNAAGGSYSGGDGGSNGGDGTGSSGDIGGSGGGGIGGAAGGTPFSGDGANGADAADVSGLFAVLNAGILLPVTWTSFTVTSQNNAAALQWKTASELNVTSFTVQYSTDGINFKNIAVIPAIGNSSTTKTYNYIHQSPAQVTGYYRLFQTDNNGKSSFSAVVKNVFNAPKEKDCILFGNTVVDGSLKIQLNKPAVITLLTFDGKKIISINMEKGISYLNVSHLSKGYYLVQSANDVQKILIR
jgi:hypothetical protein